MPCGWLFFDVVVHVDGVKSSQDLVSLAKDYTHHQHGDIEMRRFFAAHVLRFGGAETVNDLDDSRLTHVVVVSDPGKSTEARNRVRHIREQLKWYVYSSQLAVQTQFCLFDPASVCLVN